MDETIAVARCVIGEVFAHPLVVHFAWGNKAIEMPARNQK